MNLTKVLAVSTFLALVGFVGSNRGSARSGEARLGPVFHLFTRRAAPLSRLIPLLVLAASSALRKCA